MPIRLLALDLDGTLLDEHDTDREIALSKDSRARLVGRPIEAHTGPVDRRDRWGR